MKIDWNKVEEGYSLMQTLEKENKQLKEEMERLNKENEELKHKLKLINSYVYGCDIDSLGSDKE